jgi:hypothetical protein
MNEANVSWETEELITEASICGKKSLAKSLLLD